MPDGSEMRRTPLPEQVVSRRIRQPLVSVVIPTYNRAGALRRCLDSLTRQTTGDFEVLVCDDGSTDDTAEVVREYADILDITYTSAENSGGPARPRNRGVALARSPYVAFLDSDDWWAPRKLAESICCLERGADVVYHDLFLVTRADQRTFWRRVRARDLRPPVYRDLVTSGNALPLSSVVMRRSLLLTIAAMPEDRTVVAMEDFVCWLNAARVTEKFARIHETLGYYWAGGGNISADAKTIELLDIFETRYLSSGDVVEGRAPPSWLAYARGRAYYRLGDHTEARRHLSLVSVRRVSPMTSAKTVWMRLAMVFPPRLPE